MSPLQEFKERQRQLFEAMRKQSLRSQEIARQAWAAARQRHADVWGQGKEG